MTARPRARCRRGLPAAALTLAALLLGAPASSEPRYAELEREVFVRVNEHRRARGLAALGYDAEVARLAREHSRAMARGAVRFGHQGFEARTGALRQRAALRAAAENVSRHTRQRAEVPQAALEAWVRSRSHRRNLEGSYGTSGVGAARDADGTWYLTQIFVSP